MKPVIQRKIVLFILLFCIPLSIFSYTCYWRVIPSGGTVSENGSGTSLGQTAVNFVETDISHNSAVYGFWVNSKNVRLCFTADHREWNIGEIEAGESEYMLEGEQFLISNCGNCNIHFGLQVTLVDTIPWTPSIYAGDGVFNLTGQFLFSEPDSESYHYRHDAIIDEIRWASEDVYGAEGISFEPDGFDIQLWLKFIAPMISRSWSENMIEITIYGRYHIP